MERANGHAQRPKKAATTKIVTSDCRPVSQLGQSRHRRPAPTVEQCPQQAPKADLNSGFDAFAVGLPKARTVRGSNASLYGRSDPQQ